MAQDDFSDFGPGEDPTPGFYSFTGAGAGGGVDPRARTVGNLLALLLLGGGVAGVGQNLFGRPPTPALSPQARGLFQGAQGQFGQAGGVLQQLLGALQNPQIPPQMSALVEQAFQPQLGNLYAQAVEQGRRRGFQDAPGISPPGGAILGPGLANLQGQMAQSKLNLYQNQIGNLLNASQGFQGAGQAQGQLAVNLPTQAPRPSILQTLGQLGPVLGGVGGILGALNPRRGGGGSLLSGLGDLFS